MKGHTTSSEHAPCPICQGDSWCWQADDGTTGCYRINEGGEVRTDKRGQTYRLFRKEENKPKKKRENGPPDLVFDYVDLDGKPFLRVERWEPNETRKKKTHRQNVWRGNTWVPVGAQKTPLLYADRLQQAPPEALVYITEGEKKASYGASGGLLCTTAPMGACCFNRVDTPYLELLKDRTVVILPDNDGEGFKHARQVAGILKDYAARVLVLELPGLGPKGDLVDYLQAGGTARGVQDMAQRAPTFLEWQAKQGIVLDSKEDFDLPETTGLALAALVASNFPAALFVFGGRLARITTGEHGAEIEPLEVDAMRGIMARANPWKISRKAGEKPTPPPVVVVKDVLTQGRYPAALPVLEGILRVPMFSRAGELADQPGYNQCAHMWLDLPPDLNIPPLPEAPTDQHLARAREVLLEPLHDFPFADRASRAHAVAAMVAPFARKLVRGPIPIFAVTSPSIGTGKSLLTTAIAWPATGAEPGALTWTEEEEEFRKRVTALLREGAAFAVLDNVSGKVDSATLASLLTAEWWKDRLLSTNSTLRLRNDAVWMFSANNPDLSAELARRAALIRLDAQTAKPWLREGFLHSNLKGFLAQARPMLVWSALVAWRAWILAGRPLYTARRLGSFECWCEVTGGMLQVLGIPGFLENYEHFWGSVEGEMPAWEAFVSTWFAIKGPENETWAGDLFKLATSNELLTHIYASAKTERAALTAFGIALAKQTDRVFGEFRIKRVRVDRSGRAVYQVARAQTSGQKSAEVCARSAAYSHKEAQNLAEPADLLQSPCEEILFSAPENENINTTEKKNDIYACGESQRSARFCRSAEPCNHADSTPADLAQTYRRPLEDFEPPF